jgi:20S proteasome alpha/beta subunit
VTVLVWDGVTLAADKRAVSSGLFFTVTKIRKINDCLVGISDTYSCGLLMMKWFEGGAEMEKYPKPQEDKDRWSAMVVITPERKIIKYEQDPIGFEIEEKKFAFGSGRDYALGAMEMGADAVRAVEIASKFESGCGNGIDTLTFS